MTAVRRPPPRSTTLAALTRRTGSSKVITTGPRNPALTDTVAVGGVMSVTNVAPTVRFPRILIVHEGSSPEQAPLQPMKYAPSSGRAVRVTTLPGSTLFEHVALHPRPAGEEITLPAPPATFNVSRRIVIGPSERPGATSRSTGPAASRLLPTYPIV